ncbi:ABC transporter ATP-binding protein [Bailinhaonella thermotolerans]|uniref:ABC transporter ATP-binding protein n=1 Tax=Bailinhaonella thermotolerans TaxID=1070861 RepID=A0A3A4B000_9ACTN|nr:ABC transporter ATP-binding protein [Bailinhaonella thermotolerans]RJL35977.1 ABC transporter ATP-binding protein [Bailinhaonella thermotolerans]
MAAIAVRNLSKEYAGGVRALDGLDLEVADGEFFALLGPSGCGKTTLLRTIAGLEIPTSGTVSLGERDVTRLPPGRRDVAMVFQDYALFPHMDVADNIAYPLRIQRVGRQDRRGRAAEVAAGLGLRDLLARRPAQLSGGQQQRVALARAIAAHPAVFLFDEPLSNLDARLRLEARSFLKRLQRDLGVTTVFVTHDQAEALALADRIAVMSAGRITQIGTPRTVFQRPATPFVASFIGSTPMNLLPAVLSGDRLTAAGTAFPAPPGVSGEAEVQYGVRPEYLDFSAEPLPEAFEGEVAVVEHLGTSDLVTLAVPGTPGVRVVVPEGVDPAPGTRAWARPHPARGLVYESGTLL